jgi:hypothetical protein
MSTSRIRKRLRARLGVKPRSDVRRSYSYSYSYSYLSLTSSNGCTNPGDECSLWTPEQAEGLGYSEYWHVSWEAGPAEWGVLLSLGESMWLTEFELRHDHRPEVLLQSGLGWYSEPYHRFDIGFIDDGKTEPSSS